MAEKKKCTTKKQFTGDMLIAEALKLHPQSEGVFLGFGMHCLRCPMSQRETIAEAAQGHGVEIELLINELNLLLKK